jgi:hypothetical protein
LSRDAKGVEIVAAKMEAETEEEATRAKQRTAFEERLAKAKADKEAKGNSSASKGLKETAAKVRAPS